MYLARKGSRTSTGFLRHWIHTTAKVRNREKFNPSNVEREQDFVDVCIVGAGPAGLSAAIRLKQLEKEKGDGREIRVVVLEKGGEVGK
jgi:electron-transferring-flavoprotein dehydrogenase